MKFKVGAKASGLNEETSRATFTVDRIFRIWGIEAYLTSGNDQPTMHKSESLHKEGRAFDLRLPSRLVAEFYHDAWDQKIHPVDERVCEALRIQLMGDFDVILECHQDNPYAWHIHVEYDPKD